MFKIVRWAMTVLLSGVIVFCGFRIWHITDHCRQEAALHRELFAYKPQRTASTVAFTAVPSVIDVADDSPTAWTEFKDPSQSIDIPFVNQGVLDLRKRNPDVMGWITVPGTSVDYPFVQTDNNTRYLSQDIDGKSARAGTIFMDHRNNPQLRDFNTLLYGHHMRNGSMFGTLKRFAVAEFFSDHRYATLYLDDRTYELEIFAYLVVTSDNAMIYETLTLDDSLQAEYFTYVRENARQYRDISLTRGNRIVTLSTCTYEFYDARMVVLAKIADPSK